MNAIKILDINTRGQLIDEVLTLIKDIFGETYMTYNELINYFYTHGYEGKVAILNKEIVGVILYHKLHNKNIDEIKGFNNILNNYNINVEEQSTIIIDTIATKDGFRKMGIGDNLLDIILKEIKLDKDVKNIVSISWVNNVLGNSAGLFIKNQFKEICFIENFWAAESIRYGYTCPICGNPCTCDAKFFFLKNNS